METDKGTDDTMQLQLALDTVDLPGAKALLDQLHPLVNIVEIGTPFVFREGIKAVTEIKHDYPHLRILADLKIMDAGAYEAKIAFDAGADLVTVLGAAHDATIQGVIGQAEVAKKQVVADLIAVEQSVQRAGELDTMGIDYVCVHTATDMQTQGQDPLHTLRQVQPVLNRAGIAVAGGITSDMMPMIIPFRPDIVIVGSYITGHENPRQAAEAIRTFF